MSTSIMLQLQFAVACRDGYELVTDGETLQLRYAGTIVAATELQDDQDAMALDLWSQVLDSP